MSTEALDLFLSVVVPLHDDAAVVEELLDELESVCDARYASYEILLVDDCSSDETVEKVEPLLDSHKCIRLIPLSRRVGSETAITAGLESAIGDFVVTLNPRSDPPSLLPEMVDAALEGYDVVSGTTDTTRDQSLLFKLLRRVFYLLCRWLVPAEMIRGLTQYRVLSREAVNALTRVRTRRRYFSLLLSEIGYRWKTFPYEQVHRRSSTPRRELGRAIRDGLSILLRSSNFPLRLASVLGLVGSLLSLLYAGYVVAVNLILDTVMPGWTTLSLQVTGLFFLVFVMFALIGEYLNGILEDTADRPLYNIRGERISSVMLPQESRVNVLDQAVSGRPGSRPDGEPPADG